MPSTFAMGQKQWSLGFQDDNFDMETNIAGLKGILISLKNQETRLISRCR